MLAMTRFLTANDIVYGVVLVFALAPWGACGSARAQGSHSCIAMHHRVPMAGVWAWGLSLLSGDILISNQTDETDGTGNADVLLAKLGKQEIWWSQVVYRWRFGTAKVVALDQMEAWAVVEGVESVRKQRLAQAELDRRGIGVKPEEIDQGIARRLEGIEGSKITAEELARREGLSLSQWQNELRWEKSWQRYTEQFLTDANLKRHYELHRDWFDGTEREVFHILRPLKWSDRSGRDKEVSELSQLGQQIKAKEVEFETAAKKWSSGATAEQGGRLGWLTFDGPMHPSFIHAAFALREGEVSEPIETPHGVHLIWVRAVKRGELPFGRMSESVRRSLLIEEFEKLVNAYPRPPQLEWVYVIP